ncbi:spore coat protein, partial [Halomonas sp. MG34]|nr:spore coat protein [Halomonas sp. MG34]
MQNQNQQSNPNAAMNQTMSKNHGGHEMFDAHEVLAGVISMLDQYQMYDQHIHDPELKNIANRQSSFVT